MNHYRVTDKRGEVHTRRSCRTYTHAVVAHAPARPAQVGYPAFEAITKVAWGGTERLANREAKRWRSHSEWTVEVLSAEVV